MNPGIIWTLFLRFANSVTDRKGRFFRWNLQARSVHYKSRICNTGK